RYEFVALQKPNVAIVRIRNQLVSKPHCLPKEPRLIPAMPSELPLHKPVHRVETLHNRLPRLYFPILLLLPQNILPPRSDLASNSLQEAGLPSIEVKRILS